VDQLILKRASASRSDDNYDVLADGVLVGRIFKVRLGGRTPWMWTPAEGQHDDRTPTHGMRRHARLRWLHLRKAGAGIE
jgi:hypothetical protein